MLDLYKNVQPNNILDKPNQIKKLDKSNLLGSIEQLYLQLNQTRQELAELRVPSSYYNVDKVILNGMGGSRLGGRVAERLFARELKIPLIPYGNYMLPAHLDERTLVILSSYSGNTEEIVSSAQQVLNKKAKLMIFTQNGKLAKIAKEKKIPGYIGFVPRYNPCDQPRMSIGYQVLGIIFLLKGCRLLSIDDGEINKLVSFVSRTSKKYEASLPTENNLAKKLSLRLHEKIPILVGAEHIVGSLHVWRNQTNENAKQMAFYYEIPELNHHLLEGMLHPLNNKKNLHFVFVKSPLYYFRNQHRIEVTKKVLQKHDLEYSEVSLTGKSRLDQVFEAIQFGAYVGFYCAMLNNIDPSNIPWVDYFKKELKKL